MADVYNFDIPMSSPIYEITEKFRNSTARFVKGLKVGDKIRFSNDLYARPRWTSRGGSYAAECVVIKVFPNGDEEVIGGAYLREVQKGYFVGDGEFDYEKAKKNICDFTPVFRIELA